MKLKFGLALAALALATSPATARDPFAGGYSGNDSVCARNISCELVIDPVAGGKAYTVEFSAEQQGRSPDGLITRKNPCTVTTRLTKDGKQIKGTFPGGQTVEISLSGGGAVVVSKNSANPCGLPFSISGRYEAFGD
ncbi:hypothetical protein [Microvirga sp. Mcv34]|uniref:hypothetical protein n=1 Tax=Microvirga sp. Mcv34 TaxID=2926016 RepID=UPI0021C773E5|nr:hypothetical protein [Microvirga sp. Mcv34]